jgi:hypothetical protein
MDTQLSRRQILIKAGWLTAGFAGLDLMAACTAQPKAAAVEDNGPALGRSELRNPRPILFLNFKTSGSQQQPTFAAMNSDGQGERSGSWGAVWAPDGLSTAIPFNGSAPGLYLGSRATGETKKIYAAAPAERFPWTVAWSPDGRKVAAIISNAGSPSVHTGADVRFSLLIIDALQGKELGRQALPDGVLLDSPLSPPSKFRWSPDGKKILIAWEYAIVVHTSTKRIERISEKNVVAEWAPDSRAVYYLEVANCCDPGKRSVGGFYLKHLSAGTTQLTSAAEVARFGFTLGVSYGSSALSPSGSRFIFADAASQGSKGLLGLYEFKDGQALNLASPSRTYRSDESIVQLDWGPDETLIAALTLGSDWTVVHLRTLELATGSWKNLATVDLGPLGASDVTQNVDFLGLNRNLSWTQ